LRVFGDAVPLSCRCRGQGGGRQPPDLHALRYKRLLGLTLIKHVIVQADRQYKGASDGNDFGGLELSAAVGPR